MKSLQLKQQYDQQKQHENGLPSSCNIMTPDFKQLRYQRISSNFYDDKNKVSISRCTSNVPKSTVGGFKASAISLFFNAKEILKKILMSINPINILKSFKNSSFRSYNNENMGKSNINLKEDKVINDHKLKKLSKEDISKSNLQKMTIFYKNLFFKSLLKDDGAYIKNYREYISSIPKVIPIKPKVKEINSICSNKKNTQNKLSILEKKLEHIQTKFPTKSQRKKQSQKIIKRIISQEYPSKKHLNLYNASNKMKSNIKCKKNPNKIIKKHQCHLPHEEEVNSSVTKQLLLERKFAGDTIDIHDLTYYKVPVSVKRIESIQKKIIELKEKPLRYIKIYEKEAAKEAEYISKKIHDHSFMSDATGFHDNSRLETESDSSDTPYQNYEEYEYERSNIDTHQHKESENNKNHEVISQSEIIDTLSEDHYHFCDSKKINNQDSETLILIQESLNPSVESSQTQPINHIYPPRSSPVNNSIIKEPKSESSLLMNLQNKSEEVEIDNINKKSTDFIEQHQDVPIEIKNTDKLPSPKIIPQDNTTQVQISDAPIYSSEKELNNTKTLSEAQILPPIDEIINEDSQPTKIADNVKETKSQPFSLLSTTSSAQIINQQNPTLLNGFDSPESFFKSLQKNSESQKNSNNPFLLMNNNGPSSLMDLISKESNQVKPFSLLEQAKPMTISNMNANIATTNNLFSNIYNQGTISQSPLNSNTSSNPFINSQSKPITNIFAPFQGLLNPIAPINQNQFENSMLANQQSNLLNPTFGGLFGNNVQSTTMMDIDTTPVSQITHVQNNLFVGLPNPSISSVNTANNFLGMNLFGSPEPNKILSNTNIGGNLSGGYANSKKKHKERMFS